MSAALFRVAVTHARRGPVPGRFRHRLYLWLVDVDQLPRLPRVLRPLARIESRDHVGDPARSLRANLDVLLQERGIDLDGGRVELLTSARVLGHVFNPLSVWYCRGPDGTLRCLVAEVHNTHGERHAYVLEPDEHGRAEVDKAFFVSPFLDFRGRYTVVAPPPGDAVRVGVSLEQDGETVFSAALTGRRVSLSATNVLRLAARHPLVTLQVSALIRVHGLALFLRRAPRFARRAA